MDENVWLCLSFNSQITVSKDRCDLTVFVQLTFYWKALRPLEFVWLTILFLFLFSPNCLHVALFVITILKLLKKIKCNTLSKKQKKLFSLLLFMLLMFKHTLFWILIFTFYFFVFSVCWCPSTLDSIFCFCWQKCTTKMSDKYVQQICSTKM